MFHVENLLMKESLLLPGVVAIIIVYGFARLLYNPETGRGVYAMALLAGLGLVVGFLGIVVEGGGCYLRTIPAGQRGSQTGTHPGSG